MFVSGSRIWLALSPSRQNHVGYAVSVVVLYCVYSSRRMVCGWFGLRVTMTRKIQEQDNSPVGVVSLLFIAAVRVDCVTWVTAGQLCSLMKWACRCKVKKIR
jgi:hypothetical protein